ncbi:DgyrCDS12568 [Dimorphilus gyrociliatus]|uniref:Dynein regulatory complex subunit 4 n=1 Tax=Dimorphilus gyrociliatus TaxID=2664684 RepID=A0A7I8W8B8_9ANNE|nr:DgyrCDS12568 [Dimorphilus gyrociliatus]
MPRTTSVRQGRGRNTTRRNNPAVFDGVSTEEMSHKQLEQEREERNYFQLERDKVNTFWEITKRQLEEKKAELRNKDREMEDAEEQYHIEIKVYKQKVKHLLYEHQNKIAELKAESAVALKITQEEHRKEESDLRKLKRNLRVEMKEEELSRENLIRNAQLNHDEEITNLRRNYEQNAIDIEKKYEKKMRQITEELELRRKTEIHEIEERKNSQINTLMKNHEKAFSDIKNYYNDITLNNLALINTLKEQVEEMKKKEERMEKHVAEVNSENKKLVEPLRQTRLDLEELKHQLSNYEKDKLSLASAKARLKVLKGEHKELIWERDILEQRFEKVQKERDDIYEKFIKGIQEVQQKSNFKNFLLEKKLTALTETLEMKQAQLNEVLAASNLDPTALTNVSKKLEDVLDSKNVAIKDLQFELARVCKAHNDLLRTYESKLSQFGIPTEELGFKPLESEINKQQIGLGAAGLVSAST